MDTKADQGTLFELSPPPKIVEVIHSDGQVLVRLRGNDVFLHAEGDISSMHVAAVALSQIDGVGVGDVAEAFGISREHLSRLRRAYLDNGMLGIVSRRGPKGKSKLTAAVCRRIRRLKEKGWTHERIAEKVKVSTASVSRALRDPKRLDGQQLPLATEDADELEQPEPASEGAVNCPEHGTAGVVTADVPESTRGERPEGQETPPSAEPLEGPEEFPQSQAPAGAPSQPLPQEDRDPPASVSRELPEEPMAVQFAGGMLLHEPLRLLGLVESFEAAGASLEPARYFDLAGILGILALGLGVGLDCVEQFKHLVRADLGALAALPLAPELRTLRRKLEELCDSADAVLVGRALARANLQLEPAWEGLYYVDGHFITYHGTHAVPRSRDPRTGRKGVKGRTDTYVHDVNGRPIFYMSSPVNPQLVSTIPAILGELFEVAGDNEDIILMFDRGGWSPKLFNSLDDQNVGFAVYVKGEPAGYVAPADSEFEEASWEFEGRRHTYSVAETSLVLDGVEYRVIVFQDGKAKIAIVTNVRTWPAAKIVHLLKLRWRQENNLKDLVYNKWLDGMVEYGGDEEPDPTLVPNPDRVKLKAELTETQEKMAEVEARLGKAALDNPERKRRTMRGFKIAHAALARRHRQLQEKVERLQADIAKIPARVSRCDLDETSLRYILRTQRRNMVNAVKLTVLNAERWLARRFVVHFPDPNEYRAILRHLLRQPGELHYRREAGEVDVRLASPDSPKVRRGLQGLLDELNETNPRTLDGKWRINYGLM